MLGVASVDEADRGDGVQAFLNDHLVHREVAGAIGQPFNWRTAHIHGECRSKYGLNAGSSEGDQELLAPPPDDLKLRVKRSSDEDNVSRPSRSQSLRSVDASSEAAVRRYELTQCDSHNSRQPFGELNPTNELRDVWREVPRVWCRQLGGYGEIIQVEE